MCDPELKKIVEMSKEELIDEIIADQRIHLQKHGVDQLRQPAVAVRANACYERIKKDSGIGVMAVTEPSSELKLSDLFREHRDNGPYM